MTQIVQSSTPWPSSASFAQTFARSEGSARIKAASSDDGVDGGTTSDHQRASCFSYEVLTVFPVASCCQGLSQ